MRIPNETFLVEVRDKDGVKFSGEVRAVTSFDAKGPFDILGHHANLIAVIQKKLILSLPEGKNSEIDVETGVLQVEKGKVRVFLGEIR